MPFHFILTARVRRKNSLHMNQKVEMLGCVKENHESQPFRGIYD